ncbi:sulfotransferase [Azospirillum largimobile]
MIDNHPDVLCLPGLTGIQYYSMWRGAILNNPIKPLSMGSLLSFISWWFRPLYDPAEIDIGLGLDGLGPDRSQHPCVDRTLFHDHFRAIRNRLLKEAGVPSDVYDESRHEVYRRCLLQAVYMAYEAARGRDPDAMTSMLFPSHSCAPEDVADLVRDFPDHRFVYMVRHPVAVYDSAIKSVSLLAQERSAAIDVFRTCINQLLLDEAPQVHGYGKRVYSLYRYPAVRKDLCVAVRLEDLHRNGRGTMERLARWLGISWSETLMESTFSGKTWWNRPMSKRVNGLNRSMAATGNFKNATEFDAKRIRLLMSGIFKHYGYQEETGRFADLLSMTLLLLPFQAEQNHFGLRESNIASFWKSAVAVICSYTKTRLAMVKFIFFSKRNRHDLVSSI